MVSEGGACEAAVTASSRCCGELNIGNIVH